KAYTTEGHGFQIRNRGSAWTRLHGLPERGDELALAILRAPLEHRDRGALQAGADGGAGQAGGDQVVAGDRQSAVANVVQPPPRGRVSGAPATAAPRAWARSAAVAARGPDGRR